MGMPDGLVLESLIAASAQTLLNFSKQFRANPGPFQ
jgi:hypothetical protein